MPSKTLRSLPSYGEDEVANRENSSVEQPRILWRALRETYRTLNQFKPLQPALQHIRSRTLDRWYAAEVEPESETLTTIQRSFTLAFTPRCGSNAICSILARNGLGRPGEFFQMPFTGGNALVLDGFTRVVSQYQRRGVFGSKMAYAHRAALDAQLGNAIPGYRRLDDILPKHRWVWLMRRDKVLQAISLCRAEMSQEWACRSALQQTRPTYPYDFVHILSRVMSIHASEVAWDAYFRNHGIRPLKIVYEDFFEDVDRQLSRLVDYLGGLPRKRAPLNKDTSFRVQRNDDTYELQQRFVSDLLRWGSHDFTRELGPPFVRWTRFWTDLGWRA